jgi:flagellar motor switch protein FliN/FliY
MADSDAQNGRLPEKTPTVDTDLAPGDTQSSPGPVPNSSDSSIGENRMDFILDIPLEVSVELGRTRMVINDLLKLGQGSVIELDKIAGETLEILANQRLVAKGEVVMVNEKYGVRLTEVISPTERLERLK